MWPWLLGGQVIWKGERAAYKLIVGQWPAPLSGCRGVWPTRFSARLSALHRVSLGAASIFVVGNTKDVA